MLQKWKFYIIGLIALAAISYITFVKIDAARIERERIRVETLENRIEDIQNDQEKKSELENLDDQSLLDRALEWVR